MNRKGLRKAMGMSEDLYINAIWQREEYTEKLEDIVLLMKEMLALTDGAGGDGRKS